MGVREKPTSWRPVLPAEKTLLCVPRDGQGLNLDPTGLSLLLCPESLKAELACFGGGEDGMEGRIS